MTTPSEYELVQEFFHAQFAVFDLYNVILDECKNDIANAKDQRDHDLSKAIFKDLVRFESEFGEFDAEFWNYVYDISDTRGVIDQRVISEGLADHKEYFFKKIESCVALLEDVVTEIKAAEYEWGDVDRLLESVERLFDASEAVIEVDPEKLDDPEIIALLGKIPPQRIAPIEVMVGSRKIKRKDPSIVMASENRLVIDQARVALAAILSDVVDDISISNCDIRLKRIADRTLADVRRETPDFLPISFGINVGMFRSFSSLIIEEFGDASAAYILASLEQCELFLSNFKSWSEYVRNSNDQAVSELDGLSVFLAEIVAHEVFEEDIRIAALELKRQDEELRSNDKTFVYSIFQSASNVISTTVREALKYISSLSGRVAKYALSKGERAVGAVALGWVLYNFDRLATLADNYQFFRWIKPVVEFIKQYAGAVT